MVLLGRRDVLKAGLALPGLFRFEGDRSLGEESSEHPKRFDEIAGFEVADAISRSRLAIQPSPPFASRNVRHIPLIFVEPFHFDRK